MQGKENPIISKDSDCHEILGREDGDSSSLRLIPQFKNPLI